MPGGNVSASLRRDRWIAMGIAATAMALYLRSLLPGIGYSGDSTKWQFLGQVGGVPHATGYPLYLALNRLFVGSVPWGSLAWRANLLSAVLGVVVVVLLFRLLRLLRLSPAVAASTALVFAFTRTFWTQSVVAEVYTLHLALMCSVLTCMARWRAGPTGGGDRSGSQDRWLLAGLILYALSFGNHMSTVLLLPGLIWFLGPSLRQVLTLRNVAIVGGAVVVAALQYGYVLHMARVGRYVEHPIRDLPDLLDYTAGAGFRERMLAFAPAELLTDRLWLSVRLTVEEYWVLLPAIAYGVWRGLRERDPERRPMFGLLLLWGLAGWLFAANFDVADVVVFFLPSFLVFAVFLGVALEDLVERSRRMGSRRVVAVAWVALAVLPVATAAIDYRRASQRGTVADAERIEAALHAADRDAVLLTDGYHDSEYLWYFLLGEDLETSRNLAMAHMVTPAQVRRYFEVGGGRIEAAVDKVRKGMGAPRHAVEPPLYTAADRQARELDAAGLGIVEVADGLWQVTAPS